MKSVVWSLVAWLLLLAASSVGAGVPPPDRDKQIVNGVCLPPGVAPFATWVPARLPRLIAIRQDGSAAPAFLTAALYEAGARRIAAAWLGDRLVIVDPAPEDENALAWYDAGAIGEGERDFFLRAEPKPSCEWKQPKPKGQTTKGGEDGRSGA